MVTYSICGIGASFIGVIIVSVLAPEYLLLALICLILSSGFFFLGLAIYDKSKSANL